MPAVTNVKKLTYRLTTERAADGSEQGYSRLLINCQSIKEAHEMQQLFSDKPHGLECAVLAEASWKAYEQTGPFVVSILINVKKFESPLFPGYNLNKALETILALNTDENMVIMIDEHFMAHLNEGFKFKKEKAIELFSIFGEELERRAAEIHTLSDFSAFIKYANAYQDQELLPMMDQFGEFEDGDKIKEQIIRARAQQAQKIKLPKKEIPPKSHSSWPNREELQRELSSNDCGSIEEKINQFQKIMPQLMKPHWANYQKKHISPTECNEFELKIGYLRKMASYCSLPVRKPLGDLIEHLAVLLEHQLKVLLHAIASKEVEAKKLITSLENAVKTTNTDTEVVRQEESNPLVANNEEVDRAQEVKKVILKEQCILLIAQIAAENVGKYDTQTGVFCKKYGKKIHEGAEDLNSLLEMLKTIYASVTSEEMQAVKEQIKRLENKSQGFFGTFSGCTEKAKLIQSAVGTVPLLERAHVFSNEKNDNCNQVRIALASHRISWTNPLDKAQHVIAEVAAHSFKELHFRFK
jgi:hypothetical protein